MVPELINLVREVQNSEIFKDYILAGGTALTLQLGHRTSTDIDLFTTKKHNMFQILNYFEKNYKEYKESAGDSEFIRVFVNKIKIEMVSDEHKIIEKPKQDEGIKYFGINEIAAMKLRAVMGRTEARDFIDIAYLLKEMSLKRMFELYKEKYETISPAYLKRTLLEKSKSIKDGEWLVGIKMIRNDIDIKDVCNIIKKEIDIYNEDVGIGKKKIKKEKDVTSKFFKDDKKNKSGR